ncbi:MAG TPA: type II toxin-antitoxin system HicA family toxin [Thermoanaerobaculia bacterium]
MVNPKRLLAKLVAGHLRNVHFREFAALVERFGFRLARIEGSHHIYQHGSLAEQLNLQEVGGEAKPYQIRQFLRLVERYDLRMKDES